MEPEWDLAIESLVGNQQEEIARLDAATDRRDSILSAPSLSLVELSFQRTCHGGPTKQFPSQFQRAAAGDPTFCVQWHLLRK